MKTSHFSSGFALLAALFLLTGCTCISHQEYEELQGMNRLYLLSREDTVESEHRTEGLEYELAGTKMLLEIEENKNTQLKKEIELLEESIRAIHLQLSSLQGHMQREAEDQDNAELRLQIAESKNAKLINKLKKQEKQLRDSELRIEALQAGPRTE